ncbi:hypothetical protein BKA69DRAFT_224314 [Paraphysoderma sedebokerense]|nr:hypothetical protein BKA69DRAFT_224314 [Paraphysoderma sedebokerense]
MIFECLLHEQKVAFVSSHLNMLTLAAESICLLLFPLKWQGILIPVLPAGLIPYLEAPVPFIVGVHSSYMPPDDDLSDVVIVNLDSNNVRVPKPVPQVPHSKRQRLLHRLKFAVRLRQHGINYGAPLSAVESFPFSRFTPSCNKSAVMVRTSRKKSSRLSRKSSQMSESGSRTPSVLTTKSSATTLSPSQDSLNVGRTKSNPALNLPAGPGHQSNAAKATGMDKKMVHKRSFVDMFKSKISSSNLMSQKSSNNIKSTLSPASSTNSLGDTLTSSAHSIHQYSIEGHTLVPFTSLIMNHQTGLGQNKYSLFGSHKTEISVSVVLQEGEICTSCSGACENIEDVWRCEACNATCHSGCRHAILTPCPKAFNESEVRKAFLKLFVSLFKTFPQYLNLPSANPVLNESPKEAIFNPDEFFKKEAFLEDLDDEVEVFLRGLIETQAFSQFLANRIEGTESSDLQYEILFFDELLKEKASRKAFNIKSHNSTFLKDQSFKISSTYHCPPPHRPSPPRIHNYTEQPIPLLDPSILSSIPKRPITSITSPQEEVILKNYIKNYHRQARIQQSLKKNTASQQEFSNWVKRAAVGLNWGGGGSGGLGTSSDDSSSPDGSMIARPLNMLEKRALIARKMDKTYSLLNDPILKATRYNSTVEQLQYVIQSLQSHETQLAELVSGINPDKRDLEEIETVLEQIKQLIQIYELELEALMPSPTDHSQVPHSPTSPVSSFPPNVVTSSQGAHLAGGAQNSPVRSIRPLSKDFSTASKIVMLEIDIPNTEFAIAFNDDGWRSRSAKGSTAGENAESAKKSGTSETGKEGEQKIQVVPEEPTNSEATTSSHSNFKVVPAQPDAEVMKEKVEEEDLEKPVEIVAADSSEAFVPKVESIPQDSPLPPEKPAVSENSHDKTPETEPKSKPVPTATDPLPEKSQESNSVPDSSNTTTEPQEQQAQQESSKLDSITTTSKVMTDENGKTGEVLISVKVEGGL